MAVERSLLLAPATQLDLARRVAAGRGLGPEMFTLPLYAAADPEGAAPRWYAACWQHQTGEREALEAACASAGVTLVTRAGVASARVARTELQTLMNVRRVVKREATVGPERVEAMPMVEGEPKPEAVAAAEREA